MARSPLDPRLAPTTSRRSAPPRPGPAPAGIPRGPSLQPRRRAGQGFGGCGGGGSGHCGPTLSRQTGGATEAGPQEVSARPRQRWRGSAAPRVSRRRRARGPVREGAQAAWARSGRGKAVSCGPGIPGLGAGRVWRLLPRKRTLPRLTLFFSSALRGGVWIVLFLRHCRAPCAQPGVAAGTVGPADSACWARAR